MLNLYLFTTKVYLILYHRSEILTDIAYRVHFDMSHNIYSGVITFFIVDITCTKTHLNI